MTASPSVFRAHRETRDFEIAFQDGRAARIPFQTLRWLCPCAVCVDEMTGKRLIQRESIPADITPLKLESAGNYAVRITWSDGHATGIFTWDRLYELAEQP